MQARTPTFAVVVALLSGACGVLPQAERGIHRKEVDSGADADTRSTDGTDAMSPDSGDASGPIDNDVDDTTDGTTSPTEPDPQPSGPALAEPIAGCAPSPVPSTGDFGADCVRRINQLRLECQNLPPLQRNESAETCADMQAADDARTGTPHGAFSSGMCNGGWAQNECPGWPGDPHDVMNSCLQMMWDEGPGPFWDGHGHYMNMTNPDFTSVACGLAVTPGGAVWVVQNFM